jgi:DNA-3-methyladenine glycosylase
VPRLGLDFYARPSVDVAPDLLGKTFVRRLDGHLLSGRIVEVEAYQGERDPGSHAFRGLTPRTRVMFGPPGHLYVYFTYGMHFCSNVVTDSEGVAGAVLLRALEPLEGLEIMEERRGTSDPLQLCSGPAKLCQALGMGRSENGSSLLAEEFGIDDDDCQVPEVGRSTRVGLVAGADLPLRFYIKGTQFVSRGRPSPVDPRLPAISPESL